MRLVSRGDFLSSIAAFYNPKNNVIRELYHQDIYEGNSFAFDEISYNRFYPVAQLNGYDFGPADFSTDFSNNYEKKFATLKIEPNQK